MVQAETEVTGLDGLGDLMGEMAPAEFEDKAKPPGPDDASPEATPEDGGTPAPADTPAVATDEPAGDAAPAPVDKKPDDTPAKDAGDAVDDGPSEEEEIAGLAGQLSHDEVSGSPSFKGVLGEVKTLRSEKQVLKERIAELEANAIGDPAAAPQAEPHDDLLAEAEGDDDIDTMTVGERKSMIKQAVKQGVAEALAPMQAERRADNSLAYVQTDIAAMKADPDIPEGLRLPRLCEEAKRHMHKNFPEMLKAIDGQPGMSRKLYDYGLLSVPTIRATVSKARSTQTDDDTRRALRGQQTTDTPQEFFELIGDADSDESTETVK